MDLSGNSRIGFIPSKVCTWLPYLVNLYLSNNKFTEEILASLNNFSFLNTIILLGNKLPSNIIVQFSNLGRLNKFSIVDNDLYSLIPPRLSNFDSSNFDGNNGLYDKPLTKYGNLSKKNLVIIIAVDALHLQSRG